MKDTIGGAKPIIAVVGFDDNIPEIISNCHFSDYEVACFPSGMAMVSEWISESLNVAAIISFSEIMALGGLSFIDAIKKKKLPDVPFLLIANHLNRNLRELALAGGITDIFISPTTERIEKRVTFLVSNWQLLRNTSPVQRFTVKSIDFGKRLFDIIFAGTALIFLSPLFLLTYILIKIESKGPAFYFSLRVGTGYRIFKFYKFRSMYVNADQKLKDLKHLNQYNIDAAATTPEVAVSTGLCDGCLASGKCQYPIFADKTQWCEKEFMSNKRNTSNSAFFKIKNDPRITRVGNFIRNTSIDELPQLWNVIIGDMSIVGNRPLPLYEAEKLTTDKYILRFSAPAGITGLWQVEKRGKGNMSEDERLLLDNVYAQSFSLKNDLKLILRTIPALLQKENV